MSECDPERLSNLANYCIVIEDGEKPSKRKLLTLSSAFKLVSKSLILTDFTLRFLSALVEVYEERDLSRLSKLEDFLRKD